MGISEIAESPIKAKPPTIEEEKDEDSIIKSPSTKLSGILEHLEPDILPDMIPLMRKKTTIVQNMGDQQKFADEQCAINTELMAKNQELEERI